MSEIGVAKFISSDKFMTGSRINELTARAQILSS